MAQLNQLPEPPFYTVFFGSKIKDGIEREYHVDGQRMFELVDSSDGHLGHMTHNSSKWDGVTNSFWETLQSIANWKRNSEHQQAQKNGIQLWYENYKLKTILINSHAEYFDICQSEFGISIE